jgi:hypothetical protein
VLVVLSTLAASFATLAGPVAAEQLFAPSSYRNSPLPPDAPTDPMSAAYVLDLSLKASAIGAHLNYESYSVPVYTVPAGQPTTQVIVDDPNHQQCAYGNPCLIEQWRNVPLPPDAVPSPGTDGHLVVYQPSSDTMWEFHRFRRVGDRPHSFHGGRIQGVSSNPGHYTDPPGTQFGATATSIPLLVGLQRVSELQAGSINHVVSFTLNNPRLGFRWPAQRGDGTNPLLISAPEGTCFRLPASLDLSAYDLTPYGLTLARAVQQYGMVMVDQTIAGLVVYGEIPTDGSDPYGGPDGILGGLDNSGGVGGVLRNFPWQRLQALAEGTC